MNNFISALRELVKTCDFGEMTDEMIRDQVVEKTNSTKIRERLLMEKELTLQKTQEMGRRIEKAIQEAKTLTEGNLQTEKVNKIAKTYRRPPKSEATSTRHQPATSSNTSCYRCGSQAHLANDRECPAKQQECHTCHKIGHFSTVCRQKQAATTGNYGGRKPRRQARVMQVNTDSTDPPSSSDEDIYVLATEKAKEKTATVLCNVKVNEVDITLMVDTGSGVSILTKTTYDKYFLPEALQITLPEQKLLSFTQHAINVVGYFECTVSYKGTTTIIKMYVVESGSDIMGRDLVKALQINIDGSSLTCNNVDCDKENDVDLPTNVQQFESMFNNDEFKPVKGFVHRVKMNENVQPISQKLRTCRLITFCSERSGSRTEKTEKT